MMVEKKRGKPAHVHGSLGRDWTPREKLKQAQAQSLKARGPRVSLKPEPWKKEQGQ